MTLEENPSMRLNLKSGNPGVPLLRHFATSVLPIHARHPPLISGMASLIAVKLSAAPLV